MSPGQNHIGLCAQASQVGQGRQDHIDQFSGQGTVSIRQFAAEHFGQGADGLALAIAGAAGIQPTALVAQEVMKPADRATGMLHKAEIRAYSA